MQQTTKIISSFETFFLYYFGNIHHTEKVYALSDKLISVFLEKYRKKMVATKVFLKFIGLETVIVHKNIHLIKNLIIIF